MSREYAHKLNQMLMIRAKNRIEDFHKPTGITKLLERNQTKNTRENFDKDFKEHIVDGIKTRNIRGLFRVPEINETNHLVVDAKEEEQKEDENNMDLPDNDVPAVPHDRVMMSYPLRRPDVRPNTMEERNLTIRSGETREPIKVNFPLIGAEGIEPIPGFEDPIFKYETKPRSINDYIKLAKSNEHKIFTVMNPLTHEPQFVMKNKGDVTKLYHQDGLSKFYKYYNQDVQRGAAKSMGIKGRIASDLYGEWKHDKLDQIRLQEHPVKFNVRDLPHDVIVVEHRGNDDDDDDPGAGAERIRDADDFIRRTGEDFMRAQEQVEEGKGDEIIKIHKDHRDDDDDADNQDFYSPTKSNRSDVYKEEILNLREMNQNLKRELEEIVKINPKMTSEYDQRLKLQEEQIDMIIQENETLREIEETATRDLENLKEEYTKKISELEHKESSNIRLGEQIKNLRTSYDEEVNRIRRFYETSANEQQNEIQQLVMNHKLETEEFRKAYSNLERNNRDLVFNYENERRKVKDFEDQLQRLNEERFTLERNLSGEIRRLKHELNEQRNNFSQMREQEINRLNESINQMNTQKQQIEGQYNQLNQEYQNLLQNMNALSTDQNQYLSTLQVKEKQILDDRNVYNTNYNTIVMEKDNIQKEAQNIISQKDQLIQQLTNEINQIRAQQQQQMFTTKPEEVKIEIAPEQPRINPEKYMIQEQVSQGTRSHGPVETGGFIETQIHDSSGNLESIDYKYRLQTGKEYQPKNFFISLLLPDRGQIQQFKLAFRNTYTQRSFNKPEDYSKFVEEELNRHFNNRAEVVVAAMKNIIDSESKVSIAFKNLYEDKLKTIKK